jgi:hypothetical protein
VFTDFLTRKMRVVLHRGLTVTCYMNQIVDHSSELNCDLSRLIMVIPWCTTLIHFSKADHKAKTHKSKINFQLILEVKHFSPDIKISP